VSIDSLVRIEQLVDRGAERFGPHPALSLASDPTSSVTYQQLQEHVSAAAGALARLDRGQRRPVMLLVSSGPDWAPALFGILRAGLVAVPLVPDLGQQSLGAAAAATQAQLIVCDGATAAIAASLAGVRQVDVTSLWSAPAQTSTPTAAPDELALLAFTSGSTGQPRAVELTHANLLANLRSLLAIRGGGPGDVLLSLLPPAHLFELVTGLLAPLACGAEVVYAGSLLPNRVVAALAEHRITHTLAVPALVDCIYREVLDQLIESGFALPERRAEQPSSVARRLKDLSAAEREALVEAVRGRIGRSLGTLVVGGAAIAPALAEVISTLGIRVEVGYGLTEASPIVSVGLVGQCPAGSVGRPVPGVLVSLGADDEILVRGKNVMRGYFHDPKGTRTALAYGWLHTGDRGRIDADGNLFIVGRLKEAIVTASGCTVHPEEIEPHYVDPLFAELCVVGMLAADGNDRPILVVAPASAEASAAQLQQAFQRLRAAAPPHCRVEELVVRKAPLPRTAAGKIRRRALAEQLAADPSRKSGL
jgi:long-chain acyl-CoA synthetase